MLTENLCEGFSCEKMNFLLTCRINESGLRCLFLLSRSPFNWQAVAYHLIMLFKEIPLRSVMWLAEQLTAHVICVRIFSSESFLVRNAICSEIVQYSFSRNISTAQNEQVYSLHS